MWFSVWWSLIRSLPAKEFFLVFILLMWNFEPVDPCENDENQAQTFWRICLFMIAWCRISWKVGLHISNFVKSYYFPEVCIFNYILLYEYIRHMMYLMTSKSGGDKWYYVPLTPKSGETNPSPPISLSDALLSRN